MPSGKKEDAMARLNMRELGRRLGVDRSTVSRALNDEKAHLVAAATRERIREEAARMGYRPDLTASALRLGRSRTVGILVSDLANTTFIEIIREIMARLGEGQGSGAAITPLIAETLDRPEATKLLLRTFLSRRVDAIISLASTELDVEALQEAAAEVPVVLAVRSIAGASFPSALCDDDAGGAMAAAHLAARGHRIVCQVRGPQTAATFKNRARGFSRVCAEQGLTEVGIAVEARSATTSEGKRALEAILKEPVRPTAAFAHNDALAIGLIEAMRQNGLDYPKDLAVIGFNDTEMSRVLATPLTTVAYPIVDVGRHAGTLVKTLIEDRTARWATGVFMPTLVARGST